MDVFTDWTMTKFEKLVFLKVLCLLSKTNLGHISTLLS